MLAAWIAHVTFWVLLAYGLAVDEISAIRAGLFVALWIAVLVALRYEAAGAMFPSFVAVLDIALVFMIFKGDVRIT